MQTYILDHVVGMRTPLDESAVRGPETVGHCRNIAPGSSSISHCQESEDVSSLCQGIAHWPRQHRSRHWQEQPAIAAPMSCNVDSAPTHRSAPGGHGGSIAGLGTPHGLVLSEEPVHCAACHSTSVVSECSCDCPLNRPMYPHLQEYGSSDVLGAGAAANETCELMDCGCNADCTSMAQESLPFDKRSTLSNERFCRWRGAERMQRITNAVASVFSPMQFGTSSRRRRSTSQARHTNKNSRSGASLYTDHPWRGPPTALGGRAHLEEPSSKPAKDGKSERKRLSLSSRLTRAFGWNARMDMVRLRFCCREMEDSYKHNFYSNKAHINAIEQAIIICLVGPIAIHHCRAG